MRAIPQFSCSLNSNKDNIRGIIYYGSEASTPATSAYPYIDSCVDEPANNLVPHLVLSAGQQEQSDLEPVGLSPTDDVILWAMDKTSFYANWENPTLLQIYNNDTSYTRRSHVISLDKANSWVYVIIEATNAIPHPIHLHGHDFSIVGQGPGPFVRSKNLFSLTNPMRRDVAMLPGSGHLVLAFKTDNPGAWLMHCHIGWHTDMGLALQFVERVEEARELIDFDYLDNNCAKWREYTELASVEQEKYDDGI